MTARLVCKQPFAAWGVVYEVGQDVDPAVWPTGTLQNRMANGWVEWQDTVAPSPAAPPVAKEKGK
jgi:hypothetical protein